MTLNLKLTREEETVLQQQEQAQGVDVDTLVRARLLGSPMIPPQHSNLTAILQSWIEEDATDDPEEIRKAEEETAELIRNLQANRVDFGEGHIALIKLCTPSRAYDKMTQNIEVMESVLAG